MKQDLREASPNPPSFSLRNEKRRLHETGSRTLISEIGGTVLNHYLRMDFYKGAYIATNTIDGQTLKGLICNHSGFVRLSVRYQSVGYCQISSSK